MVNFICSSSLCLGVTVSWPRAQQQLLQQQMNKDSAVKRSWTSVLTVGSCHHALRQLGKRRFQVHLSRQIKIMNYNKLALWLWLQHLRDKRTCLDNLKSAWATEWDKNRKKRKEKCYKCRFFFFYENNLAAFSPPNQFLLLPQALLHSSQDTDTASTSTRCLPFQCLENLGFSPLYTLTLQKPPLTVLSSHWS